MATKRPRRHGKEVLHDIDSEDDPDFPSSSSSSSTNRQQVHPTAVVPPRYWLEGIVEGVWVVLAVALGVWALVAWAVAGQGGAGACKAALHTAGRATFDLVCTTPPRQHHHPAGRWAAPTTQLLAAASSYLPRFAQDWVRDHATASHEQQRCPLTRAVVTPEPSPGAVWTVVLGLALLSLLHFRVLRHSVFRTPSRCVLALCSCVAASVVFLRFLVSADPALRGSACHAAQSTTSLEFSCTDDSLSETMLHLRSVLPLPTWQDLVALAPERGVMAWVVHTVTDVLEPGAKYVGLCLGTTLLLLPEALQCAIYTLLRRALRHPAGKLALALVVSSLALVLWLAHTRSGGDYDNVELLRYWAISSLVGFLFVQAVWPHLFRVAFFALAPAYIVGGAILFFKALAVFLHESCGAALPVSLGLSLVLFYAHSWDCTKAFGAYVLWKSLVCFTVPFYSLPTFFSFVYWWTSSLTTTIFSALTHLASSTASSSSATSSSSSSGSTHLSMPWTTLDALFLLYFVGVALTAVLNSLAALALLAAQRHLADSTTTTTQRHRHDAPPPAGLDQHHHPKRD